MNADHSYDAAEAAQVALRAIANLRMRVRDMGDFDWKWKPSPE